MLIDNIGHFPECIVRPLGFWICEVNNLKELDRYKTGKTLQRSVLCLIIPVYFTEGVVVLYDQLIIALHTGTEYLPGNQVQF